MMEVLILPIRKTSTLLNATFAAPDLTTFCRLDELGLKAVGQLIEQVARCWRAVWLTPMIGAGAAEPKALRGTW